MYGEDYGEGYTSRYTPHLKATDFPDVSTSIHFIISASVRNTCDKRKNHNDTPVKGLSTRRATSPVIGMQVLGSVKWDKTWLLVYHPRALVGCNMNVGDEVTCEGGQWVKK